MDIRDLYQQPPEEEIDIQTRNIRKAQRAFSGVSDAEGTSCAEITVIHPQGSSSTVKTYSITDPSGRTANLDEIEGHRCALGGEFLAEVDEDRDVCVSCSSLVCSRHRIDTPFGVYCFHCVNRRWITVLAILLVGGVVLCLVI